MTVSDPLKRGGVLVAVQAIALVALFFWPGPAVWSAPAPVRFAAAVLMVLGALLAVAGAWALGRDLTVWARPKTGAGLRTGGAYAISRNPIYGGLLLAGAGHVLVRGRLEPVVALAILAFVFHAKARLEERNLLAVFGSEYRDYARRVPRLLGVPRRVA